MKTKENNLTSNYYSGVNVQYKSKVQPDGCKRKNGWSIMNPTLKTMVFEEKAYPTQRRKNVYSIPHLTVNYKPKDDFKLTLRFVSADLKADSNYKSIFEKLSKAFDHTKEYIKEMKTNK